MYKGATFALLSSFLRSGLTIPVFDTVSRLRTGHESYMDRFLQRVGVSMLSGTLISVLLYPLDTLKRLAQLNGGRAAMKLYASEALLLAKQREMGFLSLYKGVGPYLTSQVLMSYFMFTFFEMFNFRNFGLK
jgi:hypothetical protein